MPSWKSGLAALFLVAGLGGPALAQQKSTSGGATGSYPASQVDGTGGAGFYAMYPGAVNYGLSGSYPSYGGYGYQGFGPGPQFGAHYPAVGANLPRAENKMVGPKDGIKKQAGKPGSPGNGTAKALPRPRKGL
jgi:hypothetical protein